jgi:hypothetical protein
VGKEGVESAGVPSIPRFDLTAATYPASRSSLANDCLKSLIDLPESFFPTRSSELGVYSHHKTARVCRSAPEKIRLPRLSTPQSTPRALGRGRRVTAQNKENQLTRQASSALGVPISGSAPPSRRSRTHSGSCLNTTPASGLWPRSLSLFGSAPLLSNRDTREAWPL